MLKNCRAQELIAFFFLSLSPISALALPHSPSLIGTWQDKQMIFERGDWVTRELKVDMPKYRFTFLRYESPTSKEPFMKIEREGLITIKKSKDNDLIYNLDFTVDKHTLIYFKELPNIAKYNIKSCATVNVPMDIIQNGCGKFASFKNIKNLFYILMFADDKRILLGSILQIPVSENLRSLLLDSRPLVRK